MKLDRNETVKKLGILISLVFVLGFASSVEAADWRMFYNTTNNKNIYYFDASSIKVAGNTKIVWMKVINENPIYNSTHNVYVKKSLANFTVDCANRTIASNSIVAYSDDENVAFSNDFSEITKPISIAPDTSGEVLMQVICKP